ncbi:MAG: glmU [Francisellaceae bacterium]|nr:glmU [Francisellaceae bacterium]
MKFSIIILAAGSGTRMQSAIPKVLHTLAGIPMLERIVKTAQSTNPEQIIVVYGPQGDQLKEAMKNYPDLSWVEQKEQQGTGHAVKQVLPFLKPVDRVLIWYGDVPLMSANTLNNFLKSNINNSLSLITTSLSNPTGFGRVIRDSNNQIQKIVEEKDASMDEKTIKEIFTGFLSIPFAKLQNWLVRLEACNAQKEYYLTDIIEQAAKEKQNIQYVMPFANWEVQGINTLKQLEQLERVYQKEIAYKLMDNGVKIVDVNRFDFRGMPQELIIGKDTFIDVNVILEGKINIGKNVKIGPNTCIKDSIIADNVEIKSNCIIENAVIKSEIHNLTTVGPFSRIRPATILEAGTKIGNFVEIKNATIGENTKVNHLSYIGDALVGKYVNIGAGTITCNYDGKSKHSTIIGDKASIGANSALIAPIKIFENAILGAGTTLIKDAPPNQLTINKVTQVSLLSSKFKDDIENN